MLRLRGARRRRRARFIVRIRAARRRRFLVLSEPLQRLRILNYRRGNELTAGGHPWQFLTQQFGKRRMRLGKRAVGARALPPAGQGLAQQLGCRQLGRHAHRIATTNNRGKGSNTAPSGDAG